MKFKIGDKVKYKLFNFGEGVIVNIDNSLLNEIVVEFKDSNDEKLHDCRGLVKSGKGWFCDEDYLEKVKENKVMNYKIGDKVKVKENLKINFSYGGQDFTKVMSGMRGKIVTIDRVSKEYGYYNIKELTLYKWTDEMFEKIEEIEETKFKLNDKVKVVKNGKYGIITEVDDEDYSSKGILNNNYKVSYLGNNENDFDYYTYFELKLIERKESILDDVEKAYLKAVIKPFEKRIDIIQKNKSFRDPHNCYIKISLRSISGNYEEISLPFFRNDKMYKNMIIEKEYTLKELDLI